ncbi:hypothetical protein NMY22_g1888 [Coprinellus aureogranulatus]|nr:hypothetical protein NMY22_g1888 [Coprinellus aureogranulatus]
MQLTSTAALALCLGALLQVKGLYLFGIMLVSLCPRIVNAIFSFIADAQYPAEPVSGIFKELGYPCYILATEKRVGSSASGYGLGIRSYVNVATTAALFVLAGAALIMRYKGQKGRLLRVLRRDGGIYYFALTGIVLGQAISRTPAIMAVRHLESNAGYWLIQICQIVVIPIAAQRLMINIRKVNCMDSRPIASKLLFAPLPPSSGDDGDEDRDSKIHFEMSGEEFKFRHGSRAGDSSAA